MDSEYDDDELTGEGEPVAFTGVDLAKFSNEDWREGYFDGLEAAHERGSGLITFAIALLSGVLIGAAGVGIWYHFST